MVPTPPFISTRIKRAGILSLAGITSIVISLGIAELVLRVHAPGVRPIESWQSEPRYMSDPDLAYVLTPNKTTTRTTGEYVETVTTDTYGFRNPRTVTTEKPPGTKRILVVGDSFTFGHGLSDWNTIPARMNLSLNNHSGKRSYDVINLGVPGYSPDQEYLLLLKNIPRFRPDIVLWNLIPGNLDDMAAAGPGYRASLLTLDTGEKLKRLPAGTNRTYLLLLATRLIPERVRHTALYNLLSTAAATIPAFTGIPDLPHDKLKDWSKNKFVGEATEIKALCVSLGCNLAVTWLPSLWDTPAFHAIPFPQQELKSRNIVTRDLRQDLGADPQLFFPIDGHPNATGAARIADVLAKTVRSLEDGD